MQKIFMGMASIGLLIGGMGVGYYFGIFLPKMENEKKDIIKQNQDAGYRYASQNGFKNPQACTIRLTGEFEKGCLKFVTEGILDDLIK